MRRDVINTAPSLEWHLMAMRPVGKAPYRGPMRKANPESVAAAARQARYERNQCATCFTAISLTGECLCGGE